MKDLQIRKDIARGTMNRVAEGQSVLGDGSNLEHHNHVRKVTPLQTKMREVLSDPQYRAEAIDPAREQRTTQRRHDKDVKPI